MKSVIKFGLSAEDSVKNRISPEPDEIDSKKLLADINIQKIAHTFNGMGERYITKLIRAAENRGVDPEQLLETVLIQTLAAEIAKKKRASSPVYWVYQASVMAFAVERIGVEKVMELSEKAIMKLGQKVASSAAGSVASKITGLELDPVDVLWTLYLTGQVEKAIMSNPKVKQLIRRVISKNLVEV